MRTEAPTGEELDCITIRPYNRGDFSGAAELINSFWPSQVLNPNRALKYIVAENAGQVVGVLLCDEVHSDMRLFNLVVRSEFRRRKIATGLIRAAEVRAQFLGLENLRLHAESDDLIGFYQGLGFVLTDSQERIMVKPLACLSTN